MAARNYPLDGGNEDPRFTIGLGYDVAQVIEAAGYPKLTTEDHFELLYRVLYQFLYVGPEVSQ